MDNSAETAPDASKFSAKDQQIVGTILGYRRAFFYVDGQYKIYLWVFIGLLVFLLAVADMLTVCARLALILMIVGAPYLFGIIGASLSGNEGLQRKTWKLRLSIERAYCKIPGGVLFTRGLPISAGDVAGLLERSGSWSEASSLRNLCLDETLKRNPVDLGNYLVFKTLQLPALQQEGRDEDVQNLVREILALAADHSADRPVQIAPCQLYCAVALAESGRFTEAITTGQNAIEILRAQNIDSQTIKLGYQLDALATCFTDLGYVYRCGGWYQEAQLCLKRAVALRLSGFCSAKEAGTNIDLVNQLTTACIWAGDLKEAQKWLAVIRGLIKDGQTIDSEASETVSINAEYLALKSGLQSNLVTELNYAEAEKRPQSFNSKLENLLMRAEYQRSVSSTSNTASAATVNAYQKAYDLVAPTNPGKDRLIERIVESERWRVESKQ